MFNYIAILFPCESMLSLIEIFPDRAKLCLRCIEVEFRRFDFDYFEMAIHKNSKLYSAVLRIFLLMLLLTQLADCQKIVAIDS